MLYIWSQNIDFEFRVRQVTLNKLHHPLTQHLTGFGGAVQTLAPASGFPSPAPSLRPSLQGHIPVPRGQYLHPTVQSL